MTADSMDAKGLIRCPKNSFRVSASLKELLPAVYGNETRSQCQALLYRDADFSTPIKYAIGHCTSQHN